VAANTGDFCMAKYSSVTVGSTPYGRRAEAIFQPAASRRHSTSSSFLLTGVAASRLLPHSMADPDRGRDETGRHYAALLAYPWVPERA